MKIYSYFADNIPNIAKSKNQFEFEVGGTWNFVSW